MSTARQSRVATGGELLALTAAALVVSLALASVARAGMIAVGETFPAWQLSDQAGRQVSSRELAGKTYLIWFYPKAMTPGCTAEGQALRDQFAAFQAKGVEILGVSFDEPAQNAEFSTAEAFPFRLLSDRDRTLALAVGAADSKEQPVARRISYVVAPDGKVLRAYDSVNPTGHAGQVLQDLDARKTD